MDGVGSTYRSARKPVDPAQDAVAPQPSSTGCFHCDMGFPMSESGNEHFWCDVTGTRDFSAPCTNSTRN